MAGKFPRLSYVHSVLSPSSANKLAGASRHRGSLAFRGADENTAAT